MLVLRAGLMGSGLRLVWSSCKSEDSVWETTAYLQRLQRLELLASITVDILAQTISLIKRTRDALPTWTDAPSVDLMEASLPAAREILANVQKLVARLSRPRAPANKEMMRLSQESIARGEGEPLSAVLTRMEEGGPLVKE